MQPSPLIKKRALTEVQGCKLWSKAGEEGGRVNRGEEEALWKAETSNASDNSAYSKREGGVEGKGGVKRQMEEIKCERGGSRAWNTEEWGNELNNEPNFSGSDQIVLLSSGFLRCWEGQHSQVSSHFKSDANNRPWIKINEDSFHTAWSLSIPSSLISSNDSYCLCLSQIQMGPGFTVNKSLLCKCSLSGTDMTRQCWSPLLCIISLPFLHNPISFTADVSNADGEMYPLPSLVHSTAPYAASW